MIVKVKVSLASIRAACRDADKLAQTLTGKEVRTAYINLGRLVEDIVDVYLTLLANRLTLTCNRT